MERPGDASCDPLAERLKVRTLSPGNAAGWLGSLTRAVKAKDDAPTDAALAAIAHTERGDLVWTTIISHLSVAAARTGKMSLDEAMTTVIAIVSATAKKKVFSGFRCGSGFRGKRFWLSLYYVVFSRRQYVWLAAE